MTDEPENLTLKLLREMRSEQERLASMLGKVTDAVTQIARTQDHHGEVLARHSELLGQILHVPAKRGTRHPALFWRQHVMDLTSHAG